LITLVTGGAGFIGRQLSTLLARFGHEVRIFDNLSLSSQNLVPTGSNIRFYQNELRDQKALMAAMKDCDVVYHLAAPSSVIMYEENPYESTSTTIEGFLALLEAVRLCDVEKLVYASTAAVYEGQALPYEESMALPKPVDLKALSKKAYEDLAEIYAMRYGISVAGMRPFSVYGPGDVSKHRYANVTTLFVASILQGRRPEVWGDGTQTRDFVFVDDVAHAFVLAAQRKWSNEIFNIGTGIETSFNQLVSMINGALRTSLGPVYVPVKLPVYARKLKADTTKSMKLLGFVAKVALQEGIARIIEFQTVAGHEQRRA
jgi:nucleoside-diphosphate-sugar epimerase